MGKSFPCKKVGQVYARFLHPEEIMACSGLYQTTEGLCPAQPGDALAIDAGGSWILPGAAFPDVYRFLREGADGFCWYEVQQMRTARQMEREFILTDARGRRLVGKPGDYLVTDGRTFWPVARDIFEATYQPLLQEIRHPQE